ncbi:hypothetical protein AB0H51_28855 [Streptomyces griseoluteus]|uniref:hypothetical protein n=1 Tax=Streptomyces griseoluteus TaxID=29306 RepID=UPI0033F591C9
MALIDDMAALAQAGGTAVLGAAATDGWYRFRDRAARLLGRGDPALESTAAERLDRTAAAVRAAADGDEGERVRAEHTELWREEFARLLLDLGLTERQQTMAELTSLTEEFPAVAAGIRLSGVTFHGPTNVQVGHHGRQENHFGTSG